MPIELRKWFILLTFSLSAVLAYACWFYARAAIPSSETGAQMAITLLLMGAIPGFMLLLKFFMAILLIKIFPSLDGNTEQL